MTNDEAEMLALEDAEAAISLARASAEPVCFITGNRFVPPLRGFGRAEEVWQDAEGQSPDIWDTYVEVFERAVQEGNVYLDAPDYDNALYVVDMNRFEHVEDAEGGDTLNDEWKLVEA